MLILNKYHQLLLLMNSAIVEYQLAYLGIGNETKVEDIIIVKISFRDRSHIT